MAGKTASVRLTVETPDGQIGTIDARDADNLPDGARILTKQEVTERKLEAEYAAKSTGQKVIDATLGGRGFNPTHEAFLEKGREAFSGGLYPAAKRVILDEAAPGAGKQYAEHLSELEEGKPGASTAGTVAGTAAGVAVGMAGGGAAGAGAARALPMNALSAAGAPIEHGVTRALGGLATKGVLGRAATQGAGMAVRGAFEGAAYAGLEQGASAVTHDTPIDGEKMYAAVGHGAILGGGLGAAFGVGGSLLSSGAKGLASKVRPPELPAAAAKRGIELPAIDADAGLRAPAPEVESPIKFAGKTVELRSGGRGGVKAEPGVSIRERLTIDPDAGLYAPQGKVEEPLFSMFSQGSNKATRRAAVEAGLYEGAEKSHEVQLARNLFKAPGKGEIKIGPRPARNQFRVDIDPDAGLSGLDDEILRRRMSVPLDQIEESVPWSTDKTARIQRAMDAGKELPPVKLGLRPDGTWGIDDGIHRIAEARARGLTHIEAETAVSVPKASPAFKMSKTGRGTRLDVGEGPIDIAQSPIKLPEIAVPEAPKGVSGVLSSPDNFARGLAQEQAWKAMGAGFGLQTTRFAKAAEKYFPNGTRDIGEVALRHGIIDGAVDGGPLKAAWSAAKTGRPMEMLPKASDALDGVGAKIGEIVDASGARITTKEIDDAMRAVISEYKGAAATRPMARSLENFANELKDSLGLTKPGASASVQDVIRERRALDRLVFGDNPTVDPKLMLESKRKLRWALEDVATNALDRASGKVPGELRAEYKTLKKDYHALSIIEEMLTDSAARASKATSFTVKDVGVGLLTGGSSAGGAAMAVGSKLLRERGNAAAAAFLSRAADQQSFQRLIDRFNDKVKSAATGIIEGPGKRERPMPSESKEAGKRAQAATQAQAQSIVRWVADHQANPQRILSSVTADAEHVSRTAGPTAAESYTASAMRAIAFVNAYIPVRERRDPLDPRSTPPLTHDEATELVAAARYAALPETILDDFAKGIVTPVGMRASQIFLKDSLLEFKLELQNQVSERMMRGQLFTQSQRLRIDKLLGYGLSRPETIQRLQSHFAMGPSGPPSAPPPGGPPPGNPPVNMKIQQTGFDAVESRLAG